MQQGWIKLHRRIMDNKMWLSEPFTFGQAWIDLLLLANHKPGVIRIRGNRVNIARGQVGWSQRTLAERWKWSRGKVIRFLSEIEKMEHMIVQQKNNITSLISIINYDLYQGDDTTDSTTDSTTDGPQTGHRQYQNKNDKNKENEKNKELLPVSTETGLTKTQQRIEKLKTEKQAIKEKIRTEFETNRAFLKEKFPLLDLDFELALMMNWVDTSFSKAKKWASGDLNLAFQNWLRKSKPPAQNQNYQPIWEDSDVRAKRILGLAHKIGKIPE